MSKASERELGELHGVLAKKLSTIITEGLTEVVMTEEGDTVVKNEIKTEAPASILSIARQFLKDNNIEADAGKGTPMGDLVDSLPFNEEEGHATQH